MILAIGIIFSLGFAAGAGFMLFICTREIE